jgi:predicted membrane metal-binding protein
METGFINSIMNELNFHNIRWILVIPVAAVITLILAFTQGIFTLLTFLLLVAVGYLFDDIIIGTKNAVVTGAISFFLGSLFTGSFLYLIPYTLLGVINGVVCGWIGGYIKTRMQ